MADISILRRSLPFLPLLLFRPLHPHSPSAAETDAVRCSAAGAARRSLPRGTGTAPSSSWLLRLPLTPSSLCGCHTPRASGSKGGSGCCCGAARAAAAKTQQRKRSACRIMLSLSSTRIPNWRCGLASLRPHVLLAREERRGGKKAGTAAVGAMHLTPRRREKGAASEKGGGGRIELEEACSS